MKKINSKGFTLVELLAVIVIMGILMMVAIPSVTRIIENSRKDNFINTAQSYNKSVKELWTGGSLKCKTNSGGTTISSNASSGTYYVKISSDTKDNAPKLLEKGGKSAWGDKDMKGYVQVVVNESKGMVGDVSGDGLINTNDGKVCLQIKEGIKEATEFQKKLCDIDGDGKVTEEDANAIGEYYVKLSTPARIGKLISERSTEFYVIVSDNTHGINVTSSGVADPNPIKSDKLARGNVVMSGAKWIETLPSTNVCTP